MAHKILLFLLKGPVKVRKKNPKNIMFISEFFPVCISKNMFPFGAKFQLYVTQVFSYKLFGIKRCVWVTRLKILISS